MTTATTNKKSFWPVIVAWLFVLFDGYDLIVYGTVQPDLMKPVSEHGYGIGAELAGTVGSLAFFGMMLGALFIGRLSDSIGRKNAIVLSSLVMTVFTVVCALAPNWQTFGVFRFLAGVGLGGLVPCCNALAADYVPKRWRGAIATLMMSGVPIGGTVAAVIGIPILTQVSWHWMFVIAVVAGVVVLPIALWTIPKDHPNKLPDGTVKHHETGRGFITLLKPPFLTISILFALATVVTLTCWYGLGTWLPTLMQKAAFLPVASGDQKVIQSLLFTIALNIGAVLGSAVAALVSAKVGPIPVAMVIAVLAGGGLLLLTLQPAVALIYVILVLAGIGSHGTQCLIIGAISTYFPDSLRGTALGWGLGIGRIGAVAAPQVGGLLLAASAGHTDPASNFVFFGVCALIAAVMLLIVWIFYGSGKNSHDERIEKLQNAAPAAV